MLALISKILTYDIFPYYYVNNINLPCNNNYKFLI